MGIRHVFVCHNNFLSYMALLGKTWPDTCDALENRKKDIYDGIALTL